MKRFLFTVAGVVLVPAFAVSQGLPAPAPVVEVPTQPAVISWEQYACDRPLPVAPTVPPVGVDCDGRATGCETGRCGRSFNPFAGIRNLFSSAPEPCPSIVVAAPACRPSARVTITSGCTKSDCSTKTGCKDTFALDRIKAWLCWTPPRGRSIPLLIPTPYQKPAMSYFACTEPAGCCAAGGCGTKGCPGGANCVKHGRVGPVLGGGLFDGHRLGSHCGLNSPCGTTKTAPCPTPSDELNCGGLRLANPMYAPSAAPGSYRYPARTAAEPTPPVPSAAVPLTNPK